MIPLVPIGILATGIAIGYLGRGKVNKNENRKEFNRGYEEGKAQNYNDLNNFINTVKSHREREDILLALFAVGISNLNLVTNGNIDNEARVHLEEYIGGISYNVETSELKNRIEMLWDEPPTFNSAMEYVGKVDQSKWHIFNELISMVSYFPSVVISGKREAYVEAWQRYYASKCE